MPCSSKLLDEFNNTFKIEDPYKLNCKESRNLFSLNKSKPGEIKNVVVSSQLQAKWNHTLL
jgi:hypothetical protein